MAVEMVRIAVLLVVIITIITIINYLTLTDKTKYDDTVRKKKTTKVTILIKTDEIFFS